MVIGAISGTTYSKGTAVVFESANPNEISIAAGGGRALAVYKDGGDSKAKSRLGVITAGTKGVAFESAVIVDSTAGISRMDVSYDATQNKFAVFHLRASNATGCGLYVVAGSLSGNTISYGTPVLLPGNAANNNTNSAPKIEFDSGSGKHLLTYTLSTGGPLHTARVATISGTNDISVGDPVNISTTNASSGSKKADIAPEGDNVLSVSFLTTSGTTSSVGHLIRGTISGTTITFDTAAVLESGRPLGKSAVLAYNPDLNRYMAQAYGSDDGDNDIYPLTATSPNSADFVGIATKTVADDAQAEIVVMGGEQSGYTGLTAGSDVYVGTDGTISSTAASPSVVAGKALSANKILIKA